MIKRYKKFNENKSNELNYSCFDWDDNILHMSTLIHMDELIGGKWKPVSVSTSKFADIRGDKQNWRLRNDSASEAFCEFRDFGPRGRSAFVDDTIESIKEGEFGPSWNAFIDTLSNGAIFAIITARGHEPEVIQDAVEYIIDTQLSESQKDTLYAHCLKFAYLFNTDYDSYDRIPKGKLSQTPLIQDYLGSCDFFGVSSDSFAKRFSLGEAANPEVGKELAIKYFVKKVDDYGKKIGSKVSVGFSDDDIRNVKHIEKLFRNELSLKYFIDYSIYDTSSRGMVQTKIKPVRETQATFGSGAQTWGTDSSVLPFTKWNNMTQNLYPSSKDFPTDDYHNQLKNKSGQISDLVKDIKEKTNKDESKKVRKFRNRKLSKK